MHEDPHPSKQELLLAADGELPSRRAARVREHLATCWHCRTLMGELEGTIAEFTHAYESGDGNLPPVDGPRALLKARMDEAGHAPQAFLLPMLRSAAAALVIASVVIAFQLRPQTHYMNRSTPEFSLTPGAIRIVTRHEVCSAGTSQQAAVPASLRHRVFEEYGMPQGKADAFEVDYLVTPELGGAEDIRNLWPQPYATTVWNAHVKDALEDRLHEMVCAGEIDLATAQHDIATDWISAYKKYFHTDKPL